MTLQYIKLDDITEQHLQELIENEVSEKKTLDYKQTISDVFNNRENKKEFILDIISFANSSGGDIYYGIVEEQGKPVEIPGIDIAKEDDLKLKIHNTLRDCIEPTIHGIDIRTVPLSNSKQVLIIRIPDSFTKPHRYKNTVQFTARNSAGKYPLDVPGLKQLFLISEAFAEQERNFRAERISNILSETMPVQMPSNPKIMIHIVPLNAFEFGNMLDLTNIIANTEDITPIWSQGNITGRYNFDGYVRYSKLQDTHSKEYMPHSYTQIYRNGIIEAVEAKLIGLHNHNRIPRAYEKAVLEAISRYTRFLDKNRVSPPILIMLSLTGVKNHRIDKSETFFDSNEVIDRDNLILPEILIENFEEDLTQKMKPAFDSIWQACGYESSYNYENGSCIYGEFKL
ncbi:MAG: hypothetical protein A2287_04395 [Candidatus Melainabacteria bacterium RIFOXYA12_FULL_32_12]|nr:MAG: hypothetical protein A2287_04395 [Candidatus Melainabacteria bacterium RIFOXYA12_FULL_32_12]